MSGFSSEEKPTENMFLANDLCEDRANFAYEMYTMFAPWTSQNDLNRIWSDNYWDCINNGGDSDYTANPKK
jgi:hypothetical protein